MKRYHCRYAAVFPAEYGAYYSVEEVDAELVRLRAQVTSQAEELRENEGVIAVWRGRTNRAEAEVEKWQRVAVWALESSAFRASEFGDKTIAFLGPDSIEPTFVDYDGTENGLLAALAKAAGEE